MEIPKQEVPVDTSNATKINNRASKVFYEQLKSDQGKKTIKYLKERGISGETAKFFQLGYSSIKKLTLYENLKNEFKEIDLDESGLFGKNDDGEHYDRFRDRLMFPIRNIKGECIAFGGRPSSKCYALSLNISNWKHKSVSKSIVMFTVVVFTK